MCGVWRQKKEIKSFFIFNIFRKGKPKPPLTPSLTYCCFLFYFFSSSLVWSLPSSNYASSRRRRELVGLQRHLRWKTATAQPVRLWVENDSCQSRREERVSCVGTTVRVGGVYFCLFCVFPCTCKKSKEFRQDNKNRKFSFPRPRWTGTGISRDFRFFFLCPNMDETVESKHPKQFFEGRPH